MLSYGLLTEARHPGVEVRDLTLDLLFFDPDQCAQRKICSKKRCKGGFLPEEVLWGRASDPNSCFERLNS